MALPVVAVGVVIAILYFGRVFFITSLIAITIAFILEPFVGLLMRVRFPRSLAAFVVCTVALALLYVMGLGAYTQLAAIYQDLPIYGQRIGDIVDGVRQKVAATEDRTYQLVVPARQRQAEQERLKAQQAEAAAAKKGKSSRTPQPIVVVQAPPGATPEEHSSPIGQFLSTSLSSLYEFFLMASFIPFLVYFMLSWRDHINRSFLQFFHGEDRMVATRSLQGIADMVRAFVVGNFLLGLMLALIVPSCSA